MLESTTITNNSTQERSSNIELLRIVSMFLIIAHHLSYHGYFIFSTDTISSNRLWIEFIEMGGKIGVDVFVLISGYFLVTSPKIKICKLLKLWIQILFYSILFYFIFVLTGQIEFSITAMLKSFFPITFTQWGFASTYLIMYLFSPYINVTLNQLSKRKYQILLILMLICWCVIPTLTNKYLESNNLIWYFFLYSVAGYIRLWTKNSPKHPFRFLMTSFIFVLLTFTYVILIDIVGLKYPIILKYRTYFYDAPKFNIFIISLCLFCGFKDLTLKYHKLINRISSTTFGVYLIHENPYMRSYLWNNIIPSYIYSNKSVILSSIIIILMIFIICSFLEYIRIILLEKHYSNILIRIDHKIASTTERFFS